MWNRIMLIICSVFVLIGPASAGDLTRAPDKDFNTLEAAGNKFPEGIWSDGTTMWVLDHYFDKIYAYNMRSKAHVQDKDFELHISVYAKPRDIWLDGMTVWVVGGRSF